MRQKALSKREKEYNAMDLDKETFTYLLKNRLASTDINLVKLDVLQFINNPKELDIWSNDYFLQLAERIRLY